MERTTVRHHRSDRLPLSFSETDLRDPFQRCGIKIHGRVRFRAVRLSKNDPLTSRSHFQQVQAKSRKSPGRTRKNWMVKTRRLHSYLRPGRPYRYLRSRTPIPSPARVLQVQTFQHRYLSSTRDRSGASHHMEPVVLWCPCNSRCSGVRIPSDRYRMEPVVLWCPCNSSCNGVRTPSDRPESRRVLERCQNLYSKHSISPGSLASRRGPSYYRRRTDCKRRW